MSRKPRVDRTREEKWQIVQEGLKGGNVSEICRRHGIAQTLFQSAEGKTDECEIASIDRALPGHRAVGFE